MGYGEIKADSVTFRDAVRAIDQRKADVATVATQLVALLKTLIDASVMDPDDYQAALRTEQAMVTANAAAADPIAAPLAVLIPASIVAKIKTEPVLLAHQDALVGQVIPFKATFYDAGGNVVPGCQDVVQYSTLGAAAIMPAAAPANTDANGVTTFDVTFTHSCQDITSMMIYPNDLAVPGWSIANMHANSDTLRHIVVSVLAVFPATAVHSVNADLEIDLFNELGVEAPAARSGITVDSSDAGCLISNSHAVPYDFGRILDAHALSVKFSAAGTYTLTAKFQSVVNPTCDMDTPDQVFTVVVS